MGPRWRLATASSVIVGLVMATFACAPSTTKSSDANPPDDPEESSHEAAHESKAAEPLLVTELTQIPRPMDHTWMDESPLGMAAVDQLNIDVYKAGGLDSQAGDAVMRKSGAIESTTSTVELTVEGNRDKVVINAVRAVGECREPLDGTLFYSPAQGVPDVIDVGFDLDSSDPIARKAEPDPNDGPSRFGADYFATEKDSLGRYDQVTYQFTARTFTQYCEYAYRFDLIVNGTARSQVIDNDGDPFRVSAPLWTSDDRSIIDCGAYGRQYIGATYATGVDLADLEKTTWLRPRHGLSCGP